MTRRKAVVWLAATCATGWLLSASLTMAAAQNVPPPGPTTGGADGLQSVVLASGCFWCTQADFDAVNGVVTTTPVYIGGKTKNPTYRQVAAGNTGHTEAVLVTFDPSRVTFQALLDTYWRNVDPLDKDGQFCDRGNQYRPGIFYMSEEQRRTAEASKAAIVASKRFKTPIVVEITKATEYTAAEDHHQAYYKKKRPSLHNLPPRLRSRRAPRGAVGQTKIAPRPAASPRRSNAFRTSKKGRSTRAPRTKIHIAAGPHQNFFLIVPLIARSSEPLPSARLSSDDFCSAAP